MYKLIKKEFGQPATAFSLESVAIPIIASGDITALNGLLSVVSQSEREGVGDVEYLKKVAGSRMLRVHAYQTEMEIQDRKSPTFGVGELKNLDDALNRILGAEYGTE